MTGKRIALRNRALTTYADGGSEQRKLSSAAEAYDILQDLFGIRLPDRTALTARIAAAFEQG